MTREFSYKECLEVEVTIAGEVESGPRVFSLAVILAGNGRHLVLNDYLEPKVLEAIRDAALDRFEREMGEKDQAARDAYVDRKIHERREER